MTKFITSGSTAECTQNLLKRTDLVFILQRTWLAYLEEIDTTAKEMVDRLIKELVVQRDVTEELKADDQFAWISAMEQINHTAEEIVFENIVYAGCVSK